MDISSLVENKTFSPQFYPMRLLAALFGPAKKEERIDLVISSIGS